MTKTDTVFRKKSIERISSVEQLDDYIRLSDPGVWFVLVAIMIMLVGACVFGIFGHIDSVVPAVGIAEDGRLVCLVKKEYGERLTDDMQLRINGSRYKAKLTDRQFVQASDVAESSMLQKEDMDPKEYVYELESYGTFKDGVYEVEIITERVSPVSFLFNTNEK